MGDFVFEVPPAARGWLDQTLWKNAYLCGIEGVPFQTSVSRQANRVTLKRRIESSARLWIACHVPSRGYRTLSTCSLRPSDRPYHLQLELARGLCSVVRDQSDLWSRGGLGLTDEFRDQLSSGTDALLRSASAVEPVETSLHAVEAIEQLAIAGDTLAELYCLQSIAFRRTRDQKLPTLFAANAIPPDPVYASSRQTHTAGRKVVAQTSGGGLKGSASTLGGDSKLSSNAKLSGNSKSSGNAKSSVNDATGDVGGEDWQSYCRAFNTVSLRTSWADIETDAGVLDFDAADAALAVATATAKNIIAGPIIDFRERLMPHWLYRIEDDFSDFYNATLSFVEKVVRRFRGRVNVWNCADGLNTPGPLPISDEHAMKLAVGILQTVRRCDPNTAAILSFDQPCGEYLARHRNGISPMHFADAIARSGLGMAGFGLGFRLGYRDTGTQPRSALDINMTIDRWATLGMPMMVTLGVPGGVGSDTRALAPADTLEYASRTQDPEAEQLRVAGPIVRTLLAKPMVHGVVWDGWHDARSHVNSHAGLIAPDGHHRPMMDYLVRLRNDFLT